MTLDDWIGSQQRIQQALKTLDTSIFKQIEDQTDALNNVLTTYKKEIDALDAIAASINRLKKSGVDVTEISRSLDEYVDAVYQQGKTLYDAEAPKSTLEKISHMKDKLESTIEATIKTKAEVNGLHTAANEYNFGGHGKADQTLINKTKAFIDNSQKSMFSSFVHSILNKFSSSYRETYKKITEAVAEHDQLSSEANVESQFECASKIRGILLMTDNNSLACKSFSSLKNEAQQIRQASDNLSLPEAEQPSVQANHHP